MTTAEIFCSTIIPTIARDTLSRAVISILTQALDAPFEVIVVNDSGRPLAPAAWQQDARVQVITTQRRERCVARNVGAALARGRYLHFLDDDDWLLPGGLQVFQSLAQARPGAWLYGAAQLTDADGTCLFQFDHQLSGNSVTPVLAGEWVPLQASIIDAGVFFAVGGFKYHLLTAQDKDLLARIGLEHDLSGTSVPVAAILRGVWASATNYANARADTETSRESILDHPGSFGRLRASAATSYWQGRLLRVFLISILWNGRRWRILNMAGRCLQAFAILILAGPHLLNAEYWRALFRQHLTRGFAPAPASRGRPLPDSTSAHAGVAPESSASA